MLLGSPVEPIAIAHDKIEDAINRVYSRETEAALDDAKEGGETDELQDLIDMTDEAPVIRWVNNLFYTAVRDRASDIHIEPTDRDVVVRYQLWTTPSATLRIASRPSLPGGERFRFPSSQEEGWRAAPGWCGSRAASLSS